MEADLTSFKFFFQSGKRENCYLAPERLCTKDPASIQLSPAMDIFAVGCVLAELFLNGDRLFDYTDLNRYRRGELRLEVALKALTGQEIFPLIEKMLSLEAESRPDIMTCCQLWQSRVFPACFSKVIFPLLSPMISTSMGKSDSDEIVSLLVENSQHIWRYLLRKSTWVHYETGEIREITEAADEGLSDPQSVLVIIDLICSHIRNLRKAKYRGLAIDILRSFIPHISDDEKMHRLLPYLVAVMTEKEEKGLIIVNALRTVVDLMAQVKTLKPQGAGIFREYIWPAIASLRQSNSLHVKLTLCRLLPDIARQGRKLLELSLNFTHSEGSGEAPIAFDAAFSELCTSIFPILRDQYLHSNKEFHSIVCSVLRQVPAIAGWDFALDLFAKLQRDWSKSGVTIQRRWAELLAELLSEEVPDAIKAMAADIAETGLFSNDEAFMHYSLVILERGKYEGRKTLEQLQRCKALLLHPNLWIRDTFEGIVRKIAAHSSPADNYIWLVPVLANMLQTRQSIYQITPELLVNCLAPALPRSFLVASSTSTPTGYSAEALQDVRDFFHVVIPYGERLSIEPTHKPPASDEKITQYSFDVQIPAVDRASETVSLPTTASRSTTVSEDFLTGRLSERTSLLKRTSSRPASEASRNSSVAEPPALNGGLLQVLAEHTSPVVSVNILELPVTYLVTAEVQGIVKVWNLNNILSPEAAETKSHNSESMACTRLRAAILLSNSKRGLVAVDNYKSNPFEAASHGFRLCSLLDYPLDTFYPLREEVGAAVSLQALPAEQLFAYTTQSGAIGVGDLRSKITALECCFGRQMGLFTVSAVGEEGQSLIVGSTSGYVLVYDLRFNSVSSVFTYSKKGCITSISPWKPDRHVCFPSLIDNDPYISLSCGTGDTDLSVHREKPMLLQYDEFSSPLPTS